jgi:hypothetical protein
LPDEGDLSSSEIFNSDFAHLAPTLLSYSGEPAKQGVPSSILLEGTGFSTRDTKVIAGGVVVDAANFQLLSRNTLQITIPDKARPRKVKNRTVIEVFVATPNGVSNHMAIKTEPKDEPKFGYTLADGDLEITVTYWPATPPVAGQPPQPFYVEGFVKPDAKIKITLKGTSGVVPEAIATSFGLPDLSGRKLSAYPCPTPIGFDPEEGAFVLGPLQLSGLAKHLAHTLVGGGVDPRTQPQDKPMELELKPVQVRPWIACRWGQEEQANNGLKVKVTFLLGAPPPALPYPPVVSCPVAPPAHVIPPPPTLPGATPLSGVPPVVAGQTSDTKVPSHPSLPLPTAVSPFSPPGSVDDHSLPPLPSTLIPETRNSSRPQSPR